MQISKLMWNIHMFTTIYFSEQCLEVAWKWPWLSCSITSVWLVWDLQMKYSSVLSQKWENCFKKHSCPVCLWWYTVDVFTWLRGELKSTHLEWTDIKKSCFFVLLHITPASFSWQSGVKNIVVISYLNNS